MEQTQTAEAFEIPDVMSQSAVEVSQRIKLQQTNHSVAGAMFWPLVMLILALFAIGLYLYGENHGRMVDLNSLRFKQQLLLQEQVEDFEELPDAANSCEPTTPNTPSDSLRCNVVIPSQPLPLTRPPPPPHNLPPIPTDRPPLMSPYRYPQSGSVSPFPDSSSFSSSSSSLV